MVTIPIRAIHTFQVRTLASLGYKTRVSLNNKSNNFSELESDYQLNISIICPSNNTKKYIENIALIKPGSTSLIDCTDWYENNEEDQILIFHLIPISKLEKYKECYEVDSDLSFKYISLSDHYVEYYLDNGYSSGVLYQCTAFNLEGLSRERSTLIQSPKIHVSNELDTYLSIIYSSIDFLYKKEVEIKYAIFEPNGSKICNSSIKMKPNNLELLSFKNILNKENSDLLKKEPFYSCTFIAICKGANLIPISINHNLKTNTIALEHSLPPIYYAKSAYGNVRSKMISDIMISRICE